MVMLDFKELINIIHVIHTCASLITVIVSLLIIKLANITQPSLIIISISSLIITVLNIFTELNNYSSLRLGQVSSDYIRRNTRNKSLVFQFIFNFLNFAASLVLIDKLILNSNGIIDKLSNKCKHLVVFDLAFIILQQLTFFSILYNFKLENQRYDTHEPEILVMKPMRITSKSKRGLVNKSSEQTLTPDVDFANLVKYENEMQGKQSKARSVNNAKWKRVFSTVLKKKTPEPSLSPKEEEINRSFQTKASEIYNNSSNINPSSQNDLHHTLSVMLDINNSKEFLSEKKLNESFERKIAAEHKAMTKMNTSLLPLRLTSKKSMPVLQGKVATASGSRINSGNSTSSNEQDLSQIPDKFHNNLQLLIENDNIQLEHHISKKDEDNVNSQNLNGNDYLNINECNHTKDSQQGYYMNQNSYEKNDVIGILDEFLTFSKHKKNQLSLDTKSIALTDEEMMSSALSDDFSYSPTKQLSSLFIPKHKKTTSLSSLSPKRQQSPSKYKHKKNSQSMFISGTKSVKKNANHKLSLSNISFDIDDNGKIDFTTPYKNVNEGFDSVKTNSSTSKSRMILDSDFAEDEEDNRKVSDKSFDYPKVLISEYDKEKWKNISDYT
ncbi:unnamed protein product [Hanseniaspora opuntiae]